MSMMKKIQIFFLFFYFFVITNFMPQILQDDEITSNQV